jgi:hypothetical protein
MIYALGIVVLACFLVTIALMAYVWTIKQGAELEKRESERKETQIQASVLEITSRLSSILDRLQKLEVRPEAPAVEQYRKVLGELEEFGHIVRNLENRMVETIESVRRTQNKIAARAKRPDANIDAQIEAITAQGDGPDPIEAKPISRRQFGQYRG